MIRPSLSVLVLIPLLLLTSGCTSPQAGSGVVVEEFTPGFTEVYPGEPITFFLKFRNKGSVQATDVFAELLGLDEDWASSSSDVADDNIPVGGEVLPRESQCKYTSEGAHYTLKPPDPVYGTEGEAGTCTWMYRTPDIPEGTNTEYDITARVFYEYNSILVKSFTLAPAQELLAYNEQGRTLPSSTVSSSSSPVTITAQARDPIRFWTNDEITFPMAITVSNKGGGMVCLPGQCKKTKGLEWNKLKLRIQPQASSSERGSGISVTVSEECQQYTGSQGGELEVWPNRDNTITCDIRVSGLGNILGHQEKLIEVVAEYSYFTDEHATITVL